MHAQAGDSGLSEEVQCPEKAEGNSHILQAGCKMHDQVIGGFISQVGKDRVVSLGQGYGGDGHLGIPGVKKGKEIEWGGGCIWLGFPSAQRKAMVKEGTESRGCPGHRGEDFSAEVSVKKAPVWGRTQV